MNLEMIDIIFIVFFLVMLIVGYIKGFVLRLYNLLATFIVFGLSLFFTKPLSSLITLYHYSMRDNISIMIGKTMNSFCVFVLLFLCLSIIQLLLGLFLKPLIQKITHFLSITSLADHVLGCLLSAIEAIVITYIVVVFIWIPFDDESQSMIEESTIVKEIVNIVPEISSQVMETGFQVKYFDIQTSSHESLLHLTLMAYHYDIIDESQAIDILEEHIFPSLYDESMNIDSRQSKDLQDILQDSGYNNDRIQSILMKLRESDK